MKYNKLEYNSALCLSSISLFLGIGISKIINSIGSNSWISIILGTAIGLLINYIFTKLPEKDNKIFIDEVVGESNLKAILPLFVNKIVNN